MSVYDEIKRLSKQLYDTPPREKTLTMLLKHYNEIKERVGGDFEFKLNDDNEICFIKIEEKDE